MHKTIRSVFLAFVVLAVLISGCAPAPTPIPPTFTASPIPPTVTLEPTVTATATVIPSPTPLPGSVVLPVDTLAESIPWLPLDKTVRPTVTFAGFNTLKPPFNSALVRQAFAHAIDRDVIVEMAIRYKSTNPVHATSLTPPETLGRDLYNEVGANFDPQKAKDLLTQAGYSDPSSFPNVLFLVNASGETAPGARYNVANAMAEMWKTHLGVTVEVQAMQSFSEYGERLRSNPSHIYWITWVADYNDPANFVGELFNPNGEYEGQYNYGNFSNAEFDQLMERAAQSKDPSERQELYIQAERLLCETEAAVIPLWHSTYNMP